jgi:hypothetical protein
VTSQRVQSTHPPFSIRAIYRTSPAALSRHVSRRKNFRRDKKLTAIPSRCDAQAQCMVPFLPLQEKNVSRTTLRARWRARFSLAFTDRLFIVRTISMTTPVPVAEQDLF